MARVAIFALAFIFAIQLTVFQAHAQTFSRGVPATAMSPEADGRQHGVPASAVSPVPPQAGVHPQRQFGTRFINQPPRPHHRFVTNRDRSNVFVPVPVFYPVYGYGDPSYPVADPYVQVPQQDANVNASDAPLIDDPAPSNSDRDLQEAYLQGARDALTHERDKVRTNDDPPKVSHTHVRDTENQAFVSPEPEAKPKEDNSPATVFIFKDGHQIETHNFAIVGQTLYDFSNTGLKKVPLTDMDKDATTKANDDRGITVKLP